MKILQVNCVYNKGSTGKIMCDIHIAAQKENIESVICYGRGEKTSDENVYKTSSELYSRINNLLSRFTGLMYGGCAFSTGKLISIIKKEKPDVVHLHCLNGYFVNIYRLISWLKESKIKTVLTLHAEFMHTANCSHAYECERWKTGCGSCPRLRRETGSLLFDRTHASWNKMKKAFEGFENLTVVSVSPWLKERAEQSPILRDHNHTVVLNGLDTDLFRVYDTENLRKELGLENKKIVFHATPSFSDDPEHIKGGYYIIKLAEKLKETRPDVVLLVAGNASLGNSIPENLLLLGRVSDQRRLAQLYSLADVTVIASKRETFSMIVAESLSCGTPIVGFKAGAPEQITIEEFSSFVNYRDVDALYSELLRFLDTEADRELIALSAKNKYSRDRMTDQYITIYKEGVTFTDDV